MQYILAVTFAALTLTLSASPNSECDFSKTSFSIFANIPLDKHIYQVDSDPDSYLKCSVFNLCGNGMTTCPNLFSAKHSYTTAFALFFLKSNTSPGLFHIKFDYPLNFNSTPVDVSIRTRKHIDFDNNTPKDWEDFDLDITQDNVFSENSKAERDQYELKSGKDTAFLDVGWNHSKAHLQAIRIQNMINLLFEPESINGIVQTLSKPDWPWIVGDAKLKVQMPKSKSPLMFENILEEFIKQHFSFCKCQKKDNMEEGDIPCRDQPKYKKFLPFFDTDSTICTTM